jgi:glycerol-3-phosphate dehydrogenase
MAEEAVDEAIAHFNLKPKGVSNPPLVSGVEGFHENIKLDGSCPTSKLKLIGAHGFSNTLFINIIQHYGIETEVAKHLTESYGDRAWMVAALCAPTEKGFPVRGERISPLYPYVDGEIRYACRHEYAETAADAIGRRTRLSFLNAQASLEALPKIIDLMAEEHQWSEKRKAFEWTDAVQYLGTMGLQPHKLTLTRDQVEKGDVGGYDEGFYARHGK